MGDPPDDDVKEDSKVDSKEIRDVDADMDENEDQEVSAKDKLLYEKNISGKSASKKNSANKEVNDGMVSSKHHA